MNKITLEDIEHVANQLGYQLKIQQNAQGETKEITLQKDHLKYIFQITGDGEFHAEDITKVIQETYQEIRKKVIDDTVHLGIAKTLEGDALKPSMEELFSVSQEQYSALSDLKQFVDLLNEK